MAPKHVVGLSGGKDSTALALAGIARRPRGRVRQRPAHSQIKPEHDMPRVQPVTGPRSKGGSMSDLKRRPRTHGHTATSIHPKGYSPTYSSWMAMHSRCRLIGRENADRYLERGVTVCDRWQFFENFLADMGERPAGTTLDRWPNASGNYEPGNCRWATPREQARNTRRSRLTLGTATLVAVRRLRGESCAEIAADFGISESLPREIVKGRCWPDALAAAMIITGGRNGTS